MIHIGITARRAFGAGTLALLALSASSACSSVGSADQSATVSYRPASFGVGVSDGFDCYYVVDRGEVADLVAAGLCPAGSIPTLIPTAYLEEYWGYYDSSAYLVYVPSGSRTHYTSYEVTFSHRYSTQISTLSRKAVYKGSNGSTVTGTSKLKFGTGTSGSAAVHGGGNARGCSLGMTVLSDKSGRSTTTTTTTHGGGNARPGAKATAKPTTRTGNGSNGSC